MMFVKRFLNLPAADLARQVLFSNFLTLEMPYKVTFALTYKCNLRCKYCRTWARTEREELRLDQIKSILTSANGLRWLHFTGGEIFLRDDIEEILNFLIAKKKLAVLAFPTNGFLTDRVVKILKALAPRLGHTKLFVTCSMDGVEDVHNRLRGNEEAHARCFETFSKLRTVSGIHSYLGVTVSRDNFSGLPTLFSGLQADIPGFSFEEMHFNFVHGSFFYNNAVSKSSEEWINEDVRLFVEKFRKENRGKGPTARAFLEERYFGLMPRYLKNKRPPLPCSALSSSCFIDPFGEVYACISYEVKIGDLRSSNYDFGAFWKLTEAKRNSLRDLIRNDKCPGCWTSCEAYPSILSNLLLKPQ